MLSLSSRRERETATSFIEHSRGSLVRRSRRRHDRWTTKDTQQRARRIRKGWAGTEGDENEIVGRGGTSVGPNAPWPSFGRFDTNYTVSRSKPTVPSSAAPLLDPLVP